MQNWLKRSLLAAGVFGICWIGAVWYWRSTTRMPDTGDLALAMLVMPLTLITAYWLAQKTFAAGGAAGPALARVDGAPETPDMPAGQDAQRATANHGAACAGHAATWLPLAMAGAELRMTHGGSPAELASAFAEGEARLALDPELTDLRGFPLLAGRVQDVELVPLEEWLSSLQPIPRAPAPQQLRAMALGGDIAARLAARASSSGGDGVLQLLPLLPPDWPAATQELAARWLAHCAAEAGWPQERLALRTPAVFAAPSAPPSAPPFAPASPLAALRALSAQAAGAAAPAFSMVLACDSSIDPDAVEQLAANGKLYGSRNPNGRMPAEGAAGILLQPSNAADGEVHLLALRADADGEATTLTALASEALASAGPEPLAYVAADTDHRAAAMSELMQCVESTVPALDTNSALACIGAACGHTGFAGAIAAIALAHQQALESGGFALALANSDPTQRFAMLVGPLPAPASKAPSLS